MHMHGVYRTILLCTDLIISHDIYIFADHYVCHNEEHKHDKPCAWI